MGFIDRTEKKFGRFAVHGLGLKIVVFQCILFLLLNSRKLPEIEKSISFFNIPGTHFITDFLLLAGMPSVYPVNALSFIWLFFGSLIHGEVEIVESHSLESKPVGVEPYSLKPF